MTRPMSAEKKRILLIGAGLVVLCALVYGRAVNYPYVRWDDPDHIFENPSMVPVTLAKIAGFWKHTWIGMYIPITYSTWSLLAWFSSAIDAAGKPNPHLFHCFNIALQAASSLLVFSMLRRMIEITPRGDLSGPRADPLPVGEGATRDWAAALGAALFAVHPLQVEAVTWISAMKDLLYSVFALAALRLHLALVSPRETAGPGHGWSRGLLYALATLSYGLAVLSKPAAVAVPLMALVVAHFVASVSWKRAIFPLLPWVVAALPIVFATERDWTMDWRPPVWLRPFVATDALAFYAGKLVAPLPLAIDYGRSPKWLFGTHEYLLTWLVPAALCAFALWQRRGRPWIAMGLMLAMLPLTPVLGLLPFKYQENSTVTDHYMHLALLGVSLMVACAVRDTAAPRLVGGIAALLVAGFSVCSFGQVPAWQDSARVLRQSLSVDPRSTSMRTALGLTFFREKRFPEAVGVFRTLAEDRFDAFEPHNNLAAALVGMGRFDEGISEYQRSLRINPDAPNTYNNLGVAYLQRRHYSDAADQFRKVLALDPDNRLGSRYLQFAIERMNAGQ
jgi:protein O-mannosyl-transferase